MNNLDGGHSITPHSLSLSFSLAIVVASLAAAHPITQSPPPSRSLFFSRYRCCLSRCCSLSHSRCWLSKPSLLAVGVGSLAVLALLRLPVLLFVLALFLSAVVTSLSYSHCGLSRVASLSLSLYLSLSFCRCRLYPSLSVGVASLFLAISLSVLPLSLLRCGVDGGCCES